MHQLVFQLLQLYLRLEEFHLLVVLWLLLVVKVQRWSLERFLLWQIKLLLAFLPRLRVPLIHLSLKALSLLSLMVLFLLSQMVLFLLSLKALFHLWQKALFTQELLPNLHFILHCFSPDYLLKSWQLLTLQLLL